MLNNNRKLYVAFIDITKAFGVLVRAIVWYTLLKVGVT